MSESKRSMVVLIALVLFISGAAHQPESDDAAESEQLADEVARLAMKQNILSQLTFTPATNVSLTDLPSRQVLDDVMRQSARDARVEHHVETLVLQSYSSNLTGK